MTKKGSITIFLALMLSLIVSLVSSGIYSARMAAARTQILNSVDIGLYSLFGQYDKKLLEDYELFFLDGSCGGGNLDLAYVYDEFVEYMKPMLEQQKTQKLILTQGGITGYSLATDREGRVFYEQIIKYMRETLGSQGVQLLLNKIQNQQQEVTKAQEKGTQIENDRRIENYQQEMDTAQQRSEEARQEMENNASSETGQLPETTPTAQVENPIPTIQRIRKMSILDLVIPSDRQISNKAVDRSILVTGRTLQKGMNTEIFQNNDTNISDSFLYQEYLKKKMGNFRKPSNTGLSYEMEYILWGKETDNKNLEEMAKKLLLIREGINFTSLMADAGKMSQVRSLAMGIASLFLVPPASIVIEGALVLCWSFAESILDVRELFSGGKVPLIKNSSNWQLSLENLSNLLNCLDSSRQGTQEGMTYEDYIQVLLFTTSNDMKIKRAMDMIELSLKATEGYEEFQLDSCIAAIEIAIDIKANDLKTYTVTRQYCYD